MPGLVGGRLRPLGGHISRPRRRSGLSSVGLLGIYKRLHPPEPGGGFVVPWGELPLEPKR